MTSNAPAEADGAGSVTDLFSYGTLRQREVQLSTFGRELDGSPDALPGYRLSALTVTSADVVMVSGASEHPLAVATGDPADEIGGVVFTLKPAELVAADRYEVADYVRVLVQLRSGIQAWAYVAATGP